MKVTVYHNVALDEAGRHLGILDGYQPDHPVTPVFTAELPDTDDVTACDELYRLLNGGDDPSFGTPDPRALAYRARGNRSLSIGDLARIDGRFYACAADGWEPVTAQPSIVHETEAHGSTPLPEAD